MFWQGIGTLIMLITCDWTIKEREWVGLAAAVVILIFEVRSIRGIFGILGSSHQSPNLAPCLEPRLRPEPRNRKLLLLTE
jgi:hypothetical protein